jgi:hypothetical protein
MKSPFLDWFVEQYGPWGAHGPLKNMSDQQLRDIVDNGHRAAAELESRTL